VSFTQADKISDCLAGGLQKLGTSGHEKEISNCVSIQEDLIQGYASTALPLEIISL
jgi:hypothetical protein